MAETKGSPVVSLIFWLVPTLVLVVFGILCIDDGWFNQRASSPDFNKIMTPVVFAAAAWCLWRGIRESRGLKRQQVGGAAEAGAETDAAAQGEELPGGEGGSGQGRAVPSAGESGEPAADEESAGEGQSR